jgi:hypothetical protein
VETRSPVYIGLSWRNQIGNRWRAPVQGVVGQINAFRSEMAWGREKASNKRGGERRLVPKSPG